MERDIDRGVRKWTLLGVWVTTFILRGAAASVPPTGGSIGA
jgi:hypothetical protein